MLLSPRSTLRLLVACMLSVVLWVIAPHAARTSENEPDIRARMDEIFESIRFLLPVSVNDEQFRNPRNKPRIRAALQSLATNSTALGEHVSDADAGMGFLSQALARHADDTLELYDESRFEDAAFFLQQVTEYCIACHTKLPSSVDAPIASHFLEKKDLSSLPLDERATLQVATRQFDDALESFEALFASELVHPAVLIGPLTDYLTVSIRVKGDYSRPIATLEQFAQRRDLWRHLRSDIESWIASLRRLEALDDLQITLETARRLIDEAKELISFPADRRALINYIAASSILNRYVESHPRSDVDLSEAYYWLGLTESRFEHDYWFSQADVYLETAIRLAPHSEFAERAYDLLEEKIILDYTGSSGVYLPEEIEAWLEELRRLIEEDGDNYKGRVVMSWGEYRDINRGE